MAARMSKRTYAVGAAQFLELLWSSPLEYVGMPLKLQDKIIAPSSSTNVAVPDNTVIIFDWDDTCLCSTAIRRRAEDPEELQTKLMELEKAVESVLRLSLGIAETWIVTNSNRTWVIDSARRFLPGLLPVLSQLKVVSARELYEVDYPGDPAMWKRAAFTDLVAATQDVHCLAPLNLVVLGDQNLEIEAAKHVGRLLGGSALVKTVKFKEAPSIADLMGQLARAEMELKKLVFGDTSKEFILVLQTNKHCVSEWRFQA